MNTVTQIEVRHGYTMQDLHAMAKQAVRADRSLASDMDTRYNAAWSAIALALCEAEDVPDRHDLVTIGWQAIYREVKEMRGIFGFKDRDGTTEVASAPRYVQYWYVRPERPDEAIAERAAVHQIMAVIPELYRDAVVALAVHDDYQIAAESIGVTYTTFTMRMTVARRQFRKHWFAPETAPPIKGTDRRVGSRNTELRSHCSAGHAFTPENTYFRPDRRRSRSCKTCEQIRGIARVAARRQEVAA
jgi:hypothetical protein